MTNLEIIDKARIIITKKAISDSVGYDNVSTISAALAIARTLEVERLQQKQNKPLLMEQLRQMDGEPVWVETSKNWKESGVTGGWGLIRFHTSDNRVRIYIYDTRHGATYYAQQDYGISWWAYSHRPL